MEKIYKAILDALDFEIVFVDTNHIIRFVNEFARKHYEEKGFTNLVGKSIFDCHNENSKKLILEGFKKLNINERKVLLYENERFKEYMIGVFDNSNLIGYFEIIEKK